MTVRPLAIALVALLLPAPQALARRSDPPGHRTANHCVTSSGADLNTIFGTSDQLVTRFCPVATAGEHWRPFGLWIVNDDHDSLPDGYVPSAPTPIEDFVSKLTAVKVVIDSGTRNERTFTYAPSAVLRTGLTADRLEPGFPALPMAATLPRLAPVSVGPHTRQLIWVMSAQHCDGFGASVEDNCLPAGPVSFGTAPFTVANPQ